MTTSAQSDEVKPESLDERATSEFPRKLMAIGPDSHRSPSPRTLNVIQGFFGAYDDSWQSYVVKVPVGSDISGEWKAYLEKKIRGQGIQSPIVFEEVSDTNPRITDKDYLYMTGEKSFAEIDDLGAEAVTKIELSDLLPTYNPKFACVLQSLINLKGIILGKNQTVFGRKKRKITQKSRSTKAPNPHFGFTILDFGLRCPCPLS